MTEGNILTVTIDQFVWGFSFHSWIFHSYGDVTIAGQGLQILTYTRHSWPLNTEGSLACHTYCDTGHPFIMVISEYPWHSYLLPGVWQWSCHYLFLRHRSVAAGIRTLNLPHAMRTYSDFNYWELSSQQTTAKYGPNIWWHRFAITCQIIMLSWPIFIASCQIFMLTCQILCWLVTYSFVKK